MADCEEVFLDRKSEWKINTVRTVKFHYDVLFFFQNVCTNFSFILFLYIVHRSVIMFLLYNEIYVQYIYL
jgi:hypothetical protein